MSHLSKLSLSDVSPREQLSPVARKRRKLLEQLDLQIVAAQHAVEGEDYVHSVRRWVRVEGSDEKKLIIAPKLLRYWWFKDETGKLMVSLRQGNRVMEIADGKNSIEVGEVANLPQVLTTLREAIAAGELDEQLKKSPYVKPIVPRKAK